MRRIFTLLSILFSTTLVFGQATQSKTATASTQTNLSNQDDWATTSSTIQAAVAASDNAYVQSSIGSNKSSEVLSLTGFDFNIPSDATIKGIEVFIERHAEIINRTNDALVRLIINGAQTGTNKAVSSFWPTSDAIATYGGSLDNWGNTISYSVINASNFGIAIQASSGPSGGISFIDQVTIKVYYTVPPVAVNDNFASNSLSASISGNVLTNDTDPNNGTLSANLVSNVSTGTLTLNSNGSFTYTPPTSNFAGGPVTFTYNTTSNIDATKTSNTATVTLNYPENTTLPVNFTSFEAKKTTTGTQLTWKVGTEENVKGYEVERSANGQQFSKVGFVSAAAENTYSFVDASDIQNTVYYRIKNVDIDGKFKYSNVISFRNGKASIVLKAFPSPVKTGFTLQHAAASKGATIGISSADGKLIKIISPAAGSIQSSVDLSNVKSGLYLIRFDDGNGAVESLKLVKQ
jgi:VCBS repeat-containing protein